jgi:CheY-like chemotaxis protein
MGDQAIFLLVEDNPDHVLLLQRAFIKGKIMNPLQLVRSGEEAIEYLSGTGRFANRAEFPLPALVLLDLKMPGIDGFEVLRWIRRQPNIATLRVVVLTTSDETRDIDLAYKLGANSFLVKPTDFERFVQVSQALSGYWIWLDKAPTVSRLPISAILGQELEKPRQDRPTP